MKIKNFLTAILAGAVMVGAMTASAMALDADTSWYSDGASSYEIDTAAELAGLATLVNSGKTFDGKTVELTEDVVLDGEWTPIGTGTRSSKSYSGNAFKGTFNGNNKTVKGLTIKSTTGADAAVGLFGIVDGGTVENLELKNVNIDVSISDLAGGAIGMMLNGAEASNITVNGSVVGHDGVGGIIGRLIIDGTISECTNKADVSSAYGGIGGIVGKAYYEDSAKTSTFANITSCVNNGTITAPMYVGGIAGLARANVTDCTNNGAIVGGTQTGGIVGQLIAAGDVSSNVNKGKIYGKNHLGGIIGDYTQSGSYSYNNATINNNVNYGELSASEQCAAIMGCNNIDGFTAISASGNLSYYTADGLVLFGNPEDMTIDDSNEFVTGVAKVGGVYYATLQEAFKAVTAENNVVEIFADVTIKENWDARYTGSKFTVPVTINGNNHTLKFESTINDNNHFSVFRFEADAVVNDLVFDLSEAVGTSNRFRAISAKADLTVDGCKFIGNPEVTNTRAIIFGEGSGTAIGDIDVSIIDCEFIDWRSGVRDNENAQDVKTVVISECEFDNAGVTISASETITFTGNVVEDAYVNIKSHSSTNTLSVTATGNELEAATGGYANKIEAAEIITDDDDFVYTAVATIGDVVYTTIQSAVNAAEDGDTVVILPGTYDESFMVTQKEGVDVTITAENKGEVTLTGTISVNGSRRQDGAETLTISNLVFDGSEKTAAHDFIIDSNGTPNYPTYAHNVTVTNCDFIGNGDFVNAPVVAFREKKAGSNNIVFDNVTADGLHSLMQISASKKLTVTNSTIINGDSGVNATGSAEVVFTGNTVDVATFAVRIGQSSGTTNTVATINMADNDIKAGETALAIRNSTATVALTNNDIDAPVTFTNTNSDTSTINNVAVTSDTIDEAIRNAGNTVAAVSITVVFEKADVDAAGDNDRNADVYNVKLVADAEKVINRLNSADLTFALTQVSGKNAYEIIDIANDDIAVNNVEDGRYEFHFSTKTGVTNDTAKEITIAQVKITGYGKYSFAVATADTNVAHATTLNDNIVDTFIPGGTSANEGILNIGEGTGEVEIFAPTQKLTINVSFPNAVENNALAYQAMNVTVTGEDIDDISIDLGTDNASETLTLTNKNDAAYTVAFDEATSVYTIEIVNALTANTAYNVTVSGAGYRTVRYTVNTQEIDKTLNFWNNVKDNETAIEEGKKTAKVTYLAGDIVKDSLINIYDLSAVVSYFGEVELNKDGKYNAYAKYDLNRDGKIDSKDVAYVLVSWGK